MHPGCARPHLRHPLVVQPVEVTLLAQVLPRATGGASQLLCCCQLLSQVHHLSLELLHVHARYT
jgi:hypothetical protein